MTDTRTSDHVDALPRQAMLLAAGRGSRLRPLTDRMPKCMVPVAGKPILEHVVTRLRDHGVDDLVINLHYMSDAVTDHFGDGSKFGVNITWAYEPTLLGTAGTVRKVANHFTGSFFVWYADNISTCDLHAMWRQHQQRAACITIALFHRDDVTSSGIVGIDDVGMVNRFLEKPRAEQVFSHWVNAGILILGPAAVAAIPDRDLCDFGVDVLPAFLAAGWPIAAHPMGASEGLWWADRVEDLAAMEAALAGGTR